MTNFIKVKTYLLIWGTSTTGTRIWLALGAILWSLMLLWPGDTFGRPTYTIMGQFAPELAWAGLFGVQGLYSLYCIYTNNQTKSALLIEGALGCALWTSSCFCMLLSVYPPPAAIAGEISAAIASWWHLIRFPFNSKGEACQEK